ncbi:MAG: class I SAM-dependent methyltransferase [Burkholderiales bacterium]
MENLEQITCPICNSDCDLLDVVDFNKSCEEPKGTFLPLSGIPVYYVLCNGCGFCFSPDLYRWDLNEFTDKIYNNDYALVDPDYLEIRPKANASSLMAMFKHHASQIRHLDFGGGNGLLARELTGNGWNSISYDPFVNRAIDMKSLGKFDLITAFEVFEHVPDVNDMMANLRTLMAPQAVLLFSTLVSDGSIVKNNRLTWWYASPRNGHISLFSKKSLSIIASQSGFTFGSFNDGFHAFFTEVPAWASHLITP